MICFSFCAAAPSEKRIKNTSASNHIKKLNQKNNAFKSSNFTSSFFFSDTFGIETPQLKLTEATLIRPSSTAIPAAVFPGNVKEQDIKKQNMLDEAKNNLKLTYLRLYNTYKSEVLQTVNANQYFNSLQKIKSLTDTGLLLNMIREINSTVFQHPVSFKNAGAAYQSQLMPSLPDSTRSYYMQQSSAEAVVNIFGVPFSGEYNYQRHRDPLLVSENRNIVSFKFDKRAYADRLKSFVPRFNPASLLPQPENMWALAKEKGVSLLRNEVAAIQNKYKGQLDSVWSEQAMQNVFESNLTSLNDGFLNPEYIRHITEAKALYDNLRSRQSAGEVISRDLLEKTQAILEKHKGMQEVMAKLTEYKKKWDELGIAQKLNEEQLLNANRVKEIIEDPEKMMQAAEKYVNINSFQRLLSKFDHLNLGQTGVVQSPLSMNNQLINGISGDFTGNRNQYLSFLGGRQRDMISLFDRQFQNPLQNRENNVAGITMGKGQPGTTHSHVSVFYFNQQQANFGNFSVTPPGRSSFVTTISNRVNFGKSSFVETEVSKSSGGYRNTINTSDSTVTGNALIKDAFASENLTDNLAFSLRFSGENEKKGLYHEFKILGTSLGYNNPGNNFLPGGTKEGAFDVRKTFLENKISLSARGNFRRFNFSTTGDTKWNNNTLFFDGRFRFKKGRSVSVRYQPSKFTRIEKDVKFINNRTTLLSADANYNASVFKKMYHTTVSLAFQNNEFAFAPGQLSSVRSLIVTSLQSLTIGTNVLNVNMVYNNAQNNTGFVFFNSTFNCDAGISYTFLKRFSCTSSAGYNAAVGWYKQLSVRQSISGQIGSKILVSFFVDARKNIKLYQPLLYDMTRGELSIMYNIF